MKNVQSGVTEPTLLRGTGKLSTIKEIKKTRQKTRLSEEVLEVFIYIFGSV